MDENGSFMPFRGKHHGFEHASVLTRTQAGQSLEQPPEKRRVFIAHIMTDFVHRYRCLLELPFGFLDPKNLYPFN